MDSSDRETFGMPGQWYPSPARPTGSATPPSSPIKAYCLESVVPDEDDGLLRRLADEDEATYPVREIPQTRTCAPNDALQQQATPPEGEKWRRCLVPAHSLKSSDGAFYKVAIQDTQRLLRDLPSFPNKGRSWEADASWDTGIGGRPTGWQPTPVGRREVGDGPFEVVGKTFDIEAGGMVPPKVRTVMQNLGQGQEEEGWIMVGNDTEEGGEEAWGGLDTSGFVDG